MNSGATCKPQTAKVWIMPLRSNGEGAFCVVASCTLQAEGAARADKVARL